MLDHELCQLLVHEEEMHVGRVRIWRMLEGQEEVGEVFPSGIWVLGDIYCPVGLRMGMKAGGLGPDIVAWERGL